VRLSLHLKLRLFKETIAGLQGVRLSLLWLGWLLGTGRQFKNSFTGKLDDFWRSGSHSFGAALLHCCKESSHFVALHRLTASSIDIDGTVHSFSLLPLVSSSKTIVEP
jgi:hypothetical protein